jgi:Mce-associated membrane protein
MGVAHCEIPKTMTISRTEEDHDYQSERGGVGMVIDDVSVHRTAKGAAMNGGSLSNDGLLEKPKGKPTKKSKQKSAKKSGKEGTPLNPGSDEHRPSPDSSGGTEHVSPTMTPTVDGRLSGEPEVGVGGNSAGEGTVTIDVDELDVDELDVDELDVDELDVDELDVDERDVVETVHHEPADSDHGPEPGGTVAATSAIEGDLQSTDEIPPSRWQRWVYSKATLLSAGALIVALVVGLTLTLSALGNQNALASSRTSALSAAKTYAVELASYNYRDLNRDFSRVTGNSTPSFRRTFAESSDALKSTLTRYKATAVANVVSAGVASASTSRAVVLVFLDQKIANSTQTKPTTDRSQVEVTVLRSGGRWLVDQVTLL